MINVKINETTLLNLFMNRLEYWTTNSDVLELYEKYLQDLIFNGCFEGAELDVDVIIDNLYVNDTAITNKEGLSQYSFIETNEDERILASDEDKDLYLVSTY